tara:strand:- start:556 stop:1428 length:873 start_codon:yes stop_codon:yes gene_type:complete
MIGNISSKCDYMSKVLSFMFKVAIFVGGISLFFYCKRIDYFPVGISFGDGLLFAFYSPIVLVVFSVFIVTLISVGLLLVNFIFDFYKLMLKVNNFFAIFTLPYIPKHRLNIKYSFPLIVLAVFGVFISLVLAENWMQLITISIISIACALMWMLLVITRKEDKYVLLYRDRKTHKANISIVNKLLALSLIVILSLFFTSLGGKLLDGSMLIAGIRKDNVNILLEDPYGKIASMQGFEVAKLSGESKLFLVKNVTVLLAGFGENIVVGKSSGDVVTARLIVPNKNVYVVGD